MAAYPTTGPAYNPNLAPVQPWNRNTSQFNNTRDSQKQWQNERQLAQYRGDQWEGEQSQNAGQYGQGEAGYTGQVADLYNPIWQGGGGYTPEMLREVQQNEGLDQIEGGLDQNYLTPEEQARIEGNPFGAFNLSKGYQGNIENIARNTGEQQQGYLPYLQGAQDAWGNRLEQSYKTAIDPNRLRVSSGYGDAVGGALSKGEAGINDPGLSVTDQYLDEAHVSDQEVDQIASAGMKDASAGYQSGINKLYRQAAESGMANPLGVASARLEYERAAAGAAADAGNMARINARATQRGAAQNIQDTQLGAAGNRAGLRLNLTGMEVGAAGDLERARMTGEQDVSSRLTSAGERLTETGINNARNLTTQGINVAGEAGDRNLGAQQYNAQMGTGLYGQGESAAANRGLTTATNRQGIGQFNTGVQFDVNQARSGRAVQAYNPWLSQQAEGRAAAQGQQAYFGGRTQDTNQLRLAGNQMQQQGTQGAASGYSNQVGIDKQPGRGLQWFNSIAGLTSKVVKPFSIPGTDG